MGSQLISDSSYPVISETVAPHSFPYISFCDSVIQEIHIWLDCSLSVPGSYPSRVPHCMDLFLLSLLHLEHFLSLSWSSVT